MAFLYCENSKCEWCQDDFWNENYNPITFLEKNYTKELLTANLNEVVEMDQGWIKEQNIHVEEGNTSLTRREIIAWELERHARSIRNMAFRTEAEYEEKNPKHKCPKCGEGLYID